MTTDSGNKALAAKLVATRTSHLQIAIECLNDAEAYDDDSEKANQIANAKSHIKAALESTPSVLEALEAQIEALPRCWNNANTHEAVELVEVFTILKNAQRTASEGSEK